MIIQVHGGMLLSSSTLHGGMLLSSSTLSSSTQGLVPIFASASISIHACIYIDTDANADARRKTGRR